MPVGTFVTLDGEPYNAVWCACKEMLDGRERLDGLKDGEVNEGDAEEEKEEPRSGIKARQ